MNENIRIIIKRTFTKEWASKRKDNAQTIVDYIIKAFKGYSSPTDESLIIGFLCDTAFDFTKEVKLYIFAEYNAGHHEDVIKIKEDIERYMNNIM